jgi:hypothetical protein
LRLPLQINGKFAPRAARRKLPRRNTGVIYARYNPTYRSPDAAEKANKLIREHEDTLAGIEATDVVQRNGVLVFSGEFYLDEQGLPTAKSTAVFNMFKYLAHELSEKSPGD